jgi:hypothetical protein
LLIASIFFKKIRDFTKGRGTDILEDEEGKRREKKAK